MYFCLVCDKTHEQSEPGTIFASGFTKKEEVVMNVGCCTASLSAKSESEGIEEKLAYSKRHAC